MKKAGIGFLLLMSAALLGAQTAVIREMTGTVETKAADAAEWKAAEPGQVLAQDSLISTGFKSTALVRIGNSDIIVRPLTRLSLEEIAAIRDGEQVILNLRVGRIRVNVKPPAGTTVALSVKSPSATASVRGTVFEFDGIHLRVEEGWVRFSGETATGTYIGQGHAAAVDTESGSAAGMLESLKVYLSPVLPAGVDVVPAAAGVPAGGALAIEILWPED
jgi:hypothetical protein